MPNTNNEKTPVLLKDGLLVPVRDNDDKTKKKKRKTDDDEVMTQPTIVDESQGTFGPDAAEFQDNRLKYQVVWNQITRHRDGNVSGRVFKLDRSMTSDVCCQIVKKYNKFAVHVGAYRISVTGGAPESYNSDSYVAKKGLSVLSMDNMEALAQLKDVLTEEMTKLKAI